MRRYINIQVEYDLDCEELKGLAITPKSKVKEIVERDMVEHFGWDDGYRDVRVYVEDIH